MYKIIAFGLWTVFFFSLSVALGLCAEPTDWEGVDIFTDGRKFGSIEDYKHYRINAMREDVLKVESSPTKTKTIIFISKYSYSPGPFAQRSLSDLLGDYLRKMIQSSQQEKPEAF